MCFNGGFKVLAIPNVDEAVAGASEAPSFVVSCHARKGGPRSISKKAPSLTLAINVPEVHVLSTSSPELFAPLLVAKGGIEHRVWASLFVEAALSRFDIPNLHIVIVGPVNRHYQAAIT